MSSLLHACLQKWNTGHSIAAVAALAAIVLCLGPGIPGPTGQSIGYFLSHGVYTAYIAVSLLLLIVRSLSKERRRARWWAADVTASSFVIVQLLKLVTALPRPSGTPTGFPSGHTTFSFALAWLVLESYPALSPLWFTLAVGIAWSRVLIHDHFPYQVDAGIFLGIAIGWAVTHLPRGILLPRVFSRKRRASRGRFPQAYKNKVSHKK